MAMRARWIGMDRMNRGRSAGRISMSITDGEAGERFPLGRTRPGRAYRGSCRRTRGGASGDKPRSVSGKPSATSSTRPSSRLRTNPETAKPEASRRAVIRNPTPWTRPPIRDPSTLDHHDQDSRWADRDRPYSGAAHDDSPRDPVYRGPTGQDKRAGEDGPSNERAVPDDKSGAAP